MANIFETLNILEKNYPKAIFSLLDWQSSTLWISIEVTLFERGASEAAKLVKTTRKIPFQDTCAWK